MQITIDTAVDSEKDIATAADMLRLFLFRRTGERFPPDATLHEPPPPPLPSGNTLQTVAEVGAQVMAAIPPTDLDSAGLPFDLRIHSESRKKNADGTWRYRRNLDAAVKDAVTSELRAYYPQAAAAAPPPPPPTVSLPAPPAAAVPPPPPPVATAPVMVPPPPPVAASVSSGPVTDFKSLMAKAGALMQAGKLTHPKLAEACVACGVQSLPALMGQPEKIPEVDAWINANVAQ